MHSDIRIAGMRGEQRSREACAVWREKAAERECRRCGCVEMLECERTKQRARVHARIPTH